MKNHNELIKINHNPNWPYIPDYPYRILIVGGLGSGKTNMLLNLIKYRRSDIDRIYLYVKDSFETKYQLLVNGREKVATENPKALICYLQTINDVYENLEDYNSTKKKRVFGGLHDPS